MTDLEKQVAKRRTFAIISHPDAGKTTLTEKLLLYGGAIQLAGTVKGRKASRHATSDWMKLEQQRGISVTSSVMQFPYGDHVVNLLVQANEVFFQLRFGLFEFRFSCRNSFYQIIHLLFLSYIHKP